MKAQEQSINQINFDYLAETLAFATCQLGRELALFSKMGQEEQDKYLDGLAKRAELLPILEDREHVLVEIEKVRSTNDRITKREALGCITFALFFGAVGGPGGAALGCGIGAAIGAL